MDRRQREQAIVDNMPEALRLLVKEYGFFETTKAIAKVGEDPKAVAGQIARQRQQKQQEQLR